MAKKKRVSEPTPVVRKSIEEYEHDIVALAYDEAEKRIRAGTATSQELTHFLKIGSTKHQLDMRHKEAEIALLEAKRESIASGDLLEDLTNKAIDALGSYRPTQSDDEFDL